MELKACNLTYYGNLKFGRTTMFQFYETNESGEHSLLELYDASGESGSISNLVYNEQSGRLTFDFSMTASGNNQSNSTHHNLSISGRFDSGERKIHKIIN